jgi:hypothetical protein
LLESGVDAIAVLGFEVFRGIGAVRRHKDPFPARYIITPYQCPTLYGTPGKKEAYIHDGNWRRGK